MTVHARRWIDSGEYVCECGWAPSWSDVRTLNEQVQRHMMDTLPNRQEPTT